MTNTQTPAPKGRALVTGAGKRLGRAMALYLGQRGYDVAVHYATAQSQAEAVAAEIRGMGRTAVALPADLLDETQTSALVGQAHTALDGPLTVLINNASIFEYDTLDSASLESWDRHIGSNLRAPFVLTQHFARSVPEAEVDAQGEPIATGLVVNMIDQRVRKLTPEFMTYTLAKMGLWALTQTAAQALAPRIRVNGVMPGAIPTEVMLKALKKSEDQLDELLEEWNIPLGRLGTPQDIGSACVYLASDAASWVSGEILRVGGGAKPK